MKSIAFSYYILLHYNNRYEALLGQLYKATSQGTSDISLIWTHTHSFAYSLTHSNLHTYTRAYTETHTDLFYKHNAHCSHIITELFQTKRLPQSLLHSLSQSHGELSHILHSLGSHHSFVTEKQLLGISHNNREQSTAFIPRPVTHREHPF